MINRPDIYVPLIYLVAAIPYAWLGLYAWRRRPAIAVTSFAQVMLGMSIWTTTYSLELFSESIPAKIFFTKIEYIGVATAPIAMLFFAVEFIGKRHVLNTSRKLLLSIIPALAVLFSWTNEFHNLMWAGEELVNIGGLNLLQLDFGTFFWIHICYTYGLLIIASLLLTMEFIQRPGIYRVQISFIILSILFPVIGSLIYVSGSGVIKNLDITPLFFLPTALGLSWATVKYRLLEILPLEHITVLESMKDSVIVLNPQYRVLYLNPSAEFLLNRTEEKAIGQPLEKITKTYAEMLIPFLSKKEVQTEVTVEEGKQARVYELSVSSILPVNQKQISNHVDTMIILHDITERKEAETTLSRRELIMSAISMAAEQFLRETAWEHNIPGVLERIGQAADVSRVSVVMNYTDENNVIHSSLCYEWAAPSVMPQINNSALRHVALRKSGLSRWEDWLSQGLPIEGFVKSFPPDEQSFYKDRESLSLAVVPIFVDSRWWGFILFDECRYERIWSATELEAFHVAANIFGAAETRARTEQKLIHRQRTLSVLHEIVEISLKATDVKDMAQIMVERLGDLINANSCFLTVWNETTKRPVPIAAFGPQKDIYTSIQLSPEERTFTELVLEAGHTMVIEDAAKDVDIHQPIVQTQSVLALPLIAEEKKLGAVILTFNQSHHFSADEISICEQASALIALSLEKFQAVEEARRRADTSEILRKASVAVAERLEMDQTALHILEQLKQVIPYDSASVQLFKNNELHIIGGIGWKDDSEVLGVSFPVPGDNPNTIVLETGKPYYLTNAWEKYPAFRRPPANGIVSWLGVPLIVQGKTIGLLAIDSFEANRFSEEDINITIQFADQVAIALENARIYQETQAQAITDSLTNIYNRRGLFQMGEFEFQRAKRINRSFSVMMFDIDHFKIINDQYSHAIGDQVLQRFAERCQKNLRAIDLFGRYGGEEFVILLPETNLQAAKVIAERLHQSIMNSPFTSDVGDLRITASIGVAETNLNETLENLIQRADVALYKAKNNGRNCVVVDEKT